MGNVYKILVGNAEGKTLPGRHRRGWKNNIRIDLRDVGREGEDCILLFRIGTSGMLL
jgi:hypothetical protein